MPVKLVLRLLRRESVKSATAGLSSSEVHKQRAARHCWRASSGTRWVAAIIGLLFLSGCRHAAKQGGSDDEDPKPIVKVEVRPVVRATLDETVEVLGTTQPLKRRTARVTTAMEGRVAAILPEADEPTNGV